MKEEAKVLRDAGAEMIADRHLERTSPPAQRHE